MTPPRHRILVVDDNPAIHDDFRRILMPDTNLHDKNLEADEAILFGRQGAEPGGLGTSGCFELTCVSQGKEALLQTQMALHDGKPFSLAFVDMRMPPGWDGAQTIQALWRVQPDMQIVICTAHTDYSWEDIVAHVGLSHRLLILKKPFDPIEVVQMACALTAKWVFERDTAWREYDLQTRLREGSKVVEQTEARLVHEQAERSRLEEGLRNVQKMEAIGGLAAGIAHDFNNILTVIQGHLGMVLSVDGLQANVAESLTEVLAAAHRATDLTRQLLSFSKREYMQPLPIDLRDAVDGEVRLLRRTLGEHISIELHHDNGVAPALVDRGSLGQIIVNLALNARDAMPNGGTLTFHTSKTSILSEEDALRLHPEAKAGDFVVLTVADNGSGMTKDVMARIFEPFFTTKDHGSGTGVGLAMVYGLMRHHGGWIDVSSQAGMGTEFKLYFPAAPAEMELEPARTVSAPAKSTSKATILVVDDDTDVRSIIEQVLKMRGHTVLTASDATEGWRMWSEHARSIQLVITDITMPGGVSGFDLGRVLNEEDKTVPVIFTSGYNPEMLAQPVDLVPGENYLPKPFDFTQLASVVDRALHNSGVSGFGGGLRKEEVVAVGAY